MRILVSACLLGLPTRYDGQSRPCEAVLRLAEQHTLIPVCPEQLGGLPTPRPPAERQRDGRVLTRDGRDVTAAYLSGAESALRVAYLARCEAAILKAKSPACGRGFIYDGSFTGQLVRGDGVLAARCLAEGLRVLDEHEVSQSGLP